MNISYLQLIHGPVDGVGLGLEGPASAGDRDV